MESNNTAVRIGNRLKELRKAKGLRQLDLADFLEIDRSTYSYYENGTTKPSVDTLMRLAEYFCVSVEYLLGDSDSLLQKDDTDGYVTVESPVAPLFFYGDLSEADFKLVKMFRRLTPDDRDKLFSFLEEMLSSYPDDSTIYPYRSIFEY